MAVLEDFEAGVNRMSNFILRHSTVQGFLMCTTALFFLMWQFSELASQIKQITELPILEARMSYTPREAHTLFHELGSDGRAIYLKANLYDTAFPILLSIWLAIIIGPLYHRAHLWPQANMFPALYLIFDLAENVAIRYLLRNFPEWDPKVAYLAGELTRYKYRFALYTFLVVVFGLLAILREMYRARKLRQRVPEEHLE